MTCDSDDGRMLGLARLDTRAGRDYLIWHGDIMKNKNNLQEVESHKPSQSRQAGVITNMAHAGRELLRKVQAGIVYLSLWGPYK